MATITLSVQAKVNQPPVANAGSDTTITQPNSSVTLNGGASSDPDGTIVAYAWSQLSGPSCTITNPSSVSTTVTGMTTPGNYTFQLQVTDNGALTNADTVVITVAAMTVYPFKWIVDSTTNSCAVNGNGYQTGYVHYAYIVKVSNDINTYPLDVNNHRISDSGLSQDRKANSGPDAIADVYNTTACNLPGGSNFRLSASFGLNIVSVTGSGSNVPAGAATANCLSGTNQQYDILDDIAPQTLTIVLSGTVSTTTKLDVLVDGVVIPSVGCQAVSAPGTFTVVLPSTIHPTNILLIAVDSGSC